MRIDPAAALHTALLGTLRSSEARTRPGFSTEPAASPPPAATTPPATAASLPASSVAMLVAAAAASPMSRKEALGRAERGIDALGRLHRLLRSGVPLEQAVAQVDNWHAEEIQTDAAAADLLRDIDLRILVELAKAGR